MARAKKRQRIVKNKSRKRRLKLAKLRVNYLATKSEAQKKAIFAKALKISPLISREEFALAAKGK